MSASTFRQLLEEAKRLGRADGRLARAFEPPGAAGRDGTACLGRPPAAFACLLWGRPGPPPAGLELTAPLWYAAGFAEGLVMVEPRHHGEISEARIGRVVT